MRGSTLLAVLLVATIAAADESYILDDSVGLGRRFDGIGGLSGGGVSCSTRKSLCRSSVVVHKTAPFHEYKKWYD